MFPGVPHGHEITQTLVFPVVRDTTSEAPAEFAAAAEQIRGARLRSELSAREIAAPERVAPHSIALAAGIIQGDSGDHATIDSSYGAGRFVLMHDPASLGEWGGPFRIVCFAQAPLEIEIGIDPFIADVTQSWLADALADRHADYEFLSGTVTKTLSSSFGSLSSRGDTAQIELRASWTPHGTDFGAHAEAWSELLCLLAGLPNEGIDSLSARRARQPLAEA